MPLKLTWLPPFFPSAQGAGGVVVFAGLFSGLVGLFSRVSAIWIHHAGYAVGAGSATDGRNIRQISLVS